MKHEPLVVNDVSKWLNEQTLRYAMRNTAGGVKIYLEFEVSRSFWIVRAASNLIYYGPDVEPAVKLFNENAY